MRHIPEDELHAYLDQGLSRTQCVEIESHLADCPSCQATRDAIAALRDRTTALLARLAPPLGMPPAFDSLRRLAAEAASLRRRRVQITAWAASLMAAVGLGWPASSFVRSAQDGPAQAPAVSAAPVSTTEASPPPDTFRPSAPTRTAAAKARTRERPLAARTAASKVNSPSADSLQA